MNDISTTALEPEDYTQAERDLGQQGLPGSLLYAAIWGLIMATTPVATDWPLVSWLGLGALLAIGGVRLALGLLFDRIHPVGPDFWIRCYSGMVMAAIWGGLAAFLIWHYVVDWPAMLVSFSSAGIVAGGTISLSTHQKMQRAYIVTALLPSMLTCWIIGDPGAAVLGVLFAAYIAYLIIAGHKLDLGYWDNLRSNRLLKRRAEELETAWKKAANADRAKSQFVAKVSHELRTPLNGLIGTLSMMHAADSPVRRKRQLDIMSKSTKLLLQRINEILDFSKLEAGRLELETIALDPVQVVNDTVEMMRDSAAIKGLKLSTELKPAQPARVIGDPSRLAQVLMNLLSNAIKFTPAGTILVSFMQEPDGPRHFLCRFSVTDSGIGISPQSQQRIFESFEQADGSTTREYGGTGLGLAVARELVQLMGGTINVSSREGEGSRFEFTLPMVAATAKCADGKTDRSSTPHTTDSALGLCVLVAEDNTMNQFIAEQMLSALGCSSELVDDGAACVDRYASSSFDLILMDCEMPQMDGYEATRRIRLLESDSGRSPVPIVALTAHVDTNSRQRARDAGMSAFVTKPFTLKELDNVLSEYRAGISG